MITIQQLSKKYGSKTIVDNWSYTFENDKIYGLIGRNGIGKTTVLKCISGLCKADAYKVSTEKGDVSKLDYLSKNINYISDDPIYYNDLTLYEHLWLVCRVENYEKATAKEKIDAFVQKFKMEEYLDYYPPAMSKGTLQRMLLIMGFLRKDENLLLDEPFNGLDPIQLKEALDCCCENKTGRCIIISSHDIESLEEVCDEFLIFTKNGIVTYKENIDRETVNRLIGDSYE